MASQSATDKWGMMHLLWIIIIPLLSLIFMIDSYVVIPYLSCIGYVALNERSRVNNADDSYWLADQTRLVTNI
jgi:hypothetical protein